MRSLVVAVLLLCLDTTTTFAHPWGGLVVDADGSIYFVSIDPIIGEEHHACVYRLEDGKAKVVLRSTHSPSDFVLARTPGRTVYAAERWNTGTRLWRLGTPTPVRVIDSTAEPTSFTVQAYAVQDDGTIWFADGGDLYTGKPENFRKVAANPDFNRIDSIELVEGTAYILDRSDLKTRDKEGIFRTLANGLKRTDPENLPFAGANILFDLAVDRGTTYVAYYGNRQILAVSPSGQTSTILESEGRWSPHGVDVSDGHLYVLESRGTAHWWQFWKTTGTIPRVRRVSTSGEATPIWAYEED